MKFKLHKSQISQDELLTILADKFPEIKEELFDTDYTNLIHLQLAVLARYTNACIENARFDEVKRIFIFFDTVIDKVDVLTENAFYVSFLEHVEMDGESKNEIYALKLLPNKYLNDYKKLRN